MVLLWFPLVALFYTFMRPTTATCWAIVGGALLLPEQIAYDLPTIPELTKRTVPYYATFLVVVIKFRDRLRAARPLRGIDGLFALMLVGTIGTVLTNGDPTGFGRYGAIGLGPYDVIVGAADDLVRVYFPFLVGRTMFRNERDLRDLLRFMAVAALLYTPLALFETVMNPVLHKWVYGWRCVDFRMTMRMGGYRPSVMYSSGLSFARFLVMALIAAIALRRAKQPVGKLPSALAVSILVVMVIAARSTGAWVLAAIVVPIAMFAGIKRQRTVSLVLGAIVVGYPLLFATGMFPHESITAFGYSINEERGSSLEDRFEQEELLTNKVASRPLFGWGGYSRAHEFDPVTGEDITVVDGEWLLVFSERGVTGFLAWFGLYLCSLWVLFRRFDELPRGPALYLFSGASLAIATMSVDMLLNSTGANPQFFFAGALYGTLTGSIARARARRRAVQVSRTKPAAAPMVDVHAPSPVQSS